MGKKLYKEVSREAGLLEIRWSSKSRKNDTQNRPLGKWARIFIEKKAGKTIRVQAIELNLPLKDYKRAVNKTLKRRVKDNTILIEKELIELESFINLVILRAKSILGHSRSKRRGKTFDPLRHNELRPFFGKEKLKTQKEDKTPLAGGYAGEMTIKSIRPVKHRTMRKQ